ncbi:DedA family protein [Orrella sp. JC864]|uniref:DedA family protein n=1 Tax=Orrella sp. JC864 TaxID=3120298 RepID=UPI0012BC2F10
MDEYIAAIEAFLKANQFWAGPVLALITMGESMLVIGLLIPATALLLMTGGLVGAGTLPMTPILLWGILGAVIGDALSYWIGRWIGPPMMRRWPLRQQRKAVARARLFFYRYGFLSILVGRFLGPIRSTIPTIAGIMKMGHVRFQIANILSAIVWVPMLLAPGYLAVRSAGAIGSHQQAGLIAGSALSVVAAIAIAYVVLRKRRAPAARKRPRA